MQSHQDTFLGLTANQLAVDMSDREVNLLVGSRLSQLRKANGLTRRALAELALGEGSEAHVSRLYSYEHGDARPPLAVLLRVARSTGHSIEVFTEPHAKRVRLHGLVQQLPSASLGLAIEALDTIRRTKSG